MDAGFSIWYSDYFIPAYGRFAVLITYELAGTIIQIYPQWQINRTCVFLYLSFQQGEVGFGCGGAKTAAADDGTLAACFGYDHQATGVHIEPMDHHRSLGLGPQPLCLSCH